MMDIMPSTDRAKRMFPLWFRHESLLVSVNIVGGTRWQLAVDRINKTSTEYKNAVQTTADLLTRIQDFQKDQSERVPLIQVELERIECQISRYDQVLRTSLHPAQLSHIDTPRREREQDEDTANTPTVPDWEREDDEDEENEENKEFMATFKIGEAREKRDELQDRLMYQAILSGEIGKAMTEFCRRPQLRNYELVQWSQATNVAISLRLLVPDPCAARKLVVQGMKRRIGEAISREKNVKLLVSPEEVEREEEKQQIAILDRVFKRITFTHNPEHPELPFHLTDENDGPNICTYCHQTGHRHVECKELYADEEEDDYCINCRVNGHHQNECWKLHPELKLERELALEKKKKAYCEICGVSGKARQYCYKVHGDTPVVVKDEPRVKQSETKAILDFPQTTVSSIMSTLPVPKLDRPYCNFCKKHGHRDKNCSEPSVLVSINDVYKHVKKPSKFAKTMK